MGMARQSWLGCSILAGAALSIWAFSAQPTPSGFSASTDITNTTPLQTELRSLERSLDAWVNGQDTMARARSLASTAEMRRLLDEDYRWANPHAARSNHSMLSSLQAGLQALSIQDRLIALAEQQVRRTEAPEAVARLIKANQRREEIIAIMIAPAVALMDQSLRSLPQNPAAPPEMDWRNGPLRHLAGI